MEATIEGPVGSTYHPQTAAGANGPSEPVGHNIELPKSQVKHPILDIYKDSPIRFRFHVLGLPHTTISEEHISCAYTQKQTKFLKMFANTRHEIIAYGNEGSEVPPGVELCTILSEKERQSMGFEPGPFNTAMAPLNWEPNEMYWRVFGLRCASYLISRVRPGDFICAVGGGWTCYQHALTQFPGCNRHGTTNAFFTDIGSGHYGFDTDFVAYESATWREHIHGKHNINQEKYCDAVIPNYFEVNDFASPNSIDRLIEEPYYLYIGRIIDLKRWKIAVDVAKILGAKIVLAGQGDPGQLEDHVIHFGLANKEQRKSLYTNAIATIVPTLYTPPFEGVAIESMLSGTPAITSDHGAFCENIDSKFRCATLREYVEAARYAQAMTLQERITMRNQTRSKFSFEAIRPLFERWFHRIWMLRYGGWNEMRDFADMK